MRGTDREYDATRGRAGRSRGGARHAVKTRPGRCVEVSEDAPDARWIRGRRAGSPVVRSYTFLTQSRHRHRGARRHRARRVGQRESPPWTRRHEMPSSSRRAFFLPRSSLRRGARICGDADGRGRLYPLIAARNRRGSGAASNTSGVRELMRLVFLQEDIPRSVPPQPSAHAHLEPPPPGAAHQRKRRDGRHK